jgi:tripartite-type tricarboxylate transporter receptor subunit TctC
MLRSGRLIALAIAVGVALWSGASVAQEPYPSRTVKIVIPSAPGSTTDTLARLVAD